jgi:hypothetical protein
MLSTGLPSHSYDYAGEPVPFDAPIMTHLANYGSGNHEGLRSKDGVRFGKVNAKGLN